MGENLLGYPPTKQLAETLFHKTQGVPFFLEELISTLRENDYLQMQGDSVDLLPGIDIPLPENVRDAIIIRVDKLSSLAKHCLSLAAVAGQRFRFELIADLVEEEGIEEAVQHGFIVKIDPEHGQFRHALTREAIYNEISWTQLRDLHRKIATRLETMDTSPGIVAEHWYAGKAHQRARQAFTIAVEKSCDIHAYSDAAEAAKRAIDLWPEGEEELRRLEFLDQLGHCLHRSGSLSEAARAWREVAQSYHQMEAHQDFAQVQRKLATVYSLQGTWDRALSAHQQAAEAFFAADMGSEGTTELLTIASHQHTAARYEQARAITDQALAHAEALGESLLKARALGLLGSLEARAGMLQEGLAKAQAGLSLALEDNLTGAASEIYQRLASVMEHFGDYQEAKETYNNAYNFCETHGISPMAQLCLACIAVVSLQTGDWEESISLNISVIESDEAPPPIKAISEITLGIIYSLRGEVKQARKFLKRSVPSARSREMTLIAILGDWGLAIADWHDDNLESVHKNCRLILEHWAQTEDRHYTIPALRFAAVDALAKMATTLSNFESLAGLSHALGEAAWVDGELDQAVEHFLKAVDLLKDKNLPLEEAETMYRAGLALLEAGQKDSGVELLTNSYHLVRSLNARAYTRRITAALKENGVSIEKLLGKREAERTRLGGLTRRQYEVLKLVALGMTNQQIAEELVLSTRTVDMHVSNVLTQLNCRSRTEAVGKAAEMGLLN
jgi:ATP/maltotriose-dependent transcriptional regulator MalT